VVVSLLDVSVLIALHLPAHEFHQRATEWFLSEYKYGWAISPITENGFVRIISQSSFPAKVASPLEAIAELKRTVSNFEQFHEFWSDSLSIRNFELNAPNLNPRDLTDLYLANLAAASGGAFVTFDRKLIELARQFSLDDVVLPIS